MDLIAAVDYPSAKAFARARPKLPGGVIAVLLCESDRHAAQSAARLVRQGASAIVAVGGSGDLGVDVPVIHVGALPDQRGLSDLMNTVLGALRGRWVLWLWNGEFFVFPYGETRTLSDLTAFLEDERRRSLYGYALDLYAPSLPKPTDAVEQATLYFDRIGYHGFPRDGQGLRLYGGLGWRFEEMTPPHLQQIGRTVLLKPGPDTAMNQELLFGDTEYDSVSCPWHHNPTGAVMSLRRSRRIMAHPAFAEVAHRLVWSGSEPFQWRSDQLLDLGMIEPGQWF